MKLELGKGQLRVLSQNPDLGEAKEDVPVEYEGEPLKIGFNARYLIEVLAVLQSADVVAGARRRALAGRAEAARRRRTRASRRSSCRCGSDGSP